MHSELKNALLGGAYEQPNALRLLSVSAEQSDQLYQKHLPFETVLMDSWYATKTVMQHIETLQKVYYCPLKSNRRVDDSVGQTPYQRVDCLAWTSQERQHGKQIKIKGCALLVWIRLKQVAHQTGQTIYQVKHGLLTDYLKKQLKQPTIHMASA